MVDVLEHFRAIETDLDFETPVHGRGPISSPHTRVFGITESFMAAAEGRRGSLGSLTSTMLGRKCLPGVRRGPAQHRNGVHQLGGAAI